MSKEYQINGVERKKKVEYNNKIWKALKNFFSHKLFVYSIRDYLIPFNGCDWCEQKRTTFFFLFQSNKKIIIKIWISSTTFKICILFRIFEKILWNYRNNINIVIFARLCIFVDLLLVDYVRFTYLDDK